MWSITSADNSLLALKAQVAVTSHNHHVRLVSPGPLVGWLDQSLPGATSRHCMESITPTTLAPAWWGTVGANACLRQQAAPAYNVRAMLDEPLIPSHQGKNSAHGQSDPPQWRVNRESLIGNARALFFAYLALMTLTPLFAQGKARQTSVDRGRPCSLPGIPARRVSEVVAASYALPPSLGADALIRVAVKLSAHCPVLAKDLLQRGFEQADTVKGDTEYKRASGSYPTDSRISYAANGYSLQLDRLSLQSRATLAMVPLDANLAIRFFERIAPPRPAAVGCSNAFVPDVSIYYEVLGKILALLRARKPRNDAEAQEPFVKMEEVIGATTSPVQLMPLVAVLEKADLTSTQLSALQSNLAAAIENFPVDDRSLSADEHWRVFAGTPIEAISKLVVLSRSRKVSSDSLVHAYRDYLDRSMRGVHCADNLPKGARPFVTASKSLNERLAALQRGIEPIGVPESEPSIEPGPAEGKYWVGPKTEQLLIDAKHLNFDDDWRPYTDADRKTPEWQGRVRLMLNHMDDWRPSDEEDPADYYHQRCMLLYRTLPYLAPGALYDSVVSAWIATFEESSLQWDNSAEWYLEVSRFLRFSKKDEKGQIPPPVLASLKNSSNAYIHASGVLAEFLE